MSGLARRSFFLSSPYRLLFTRSSSSFGVKALGDPPVVHSRRVVVTGLGMVNPLGYGVETTWNRLLKGEFGIRGLTPDDLKMNCFDKETQLYTYQQVSSKVAAVVPCEQNIPTSLMNNYGLIPRTTGQFRGL